VFGQLQLRNVGRGAGTVPSQCHLQVSGPYVGDKSNVDRCGLEITHPLVFRLTSVGSCHSSCS
jgi:hypothetical protein